MSEEIKTGWLKERDGTKFAPKTLISQVVTNDGYNYDQVVKAQMSNLKNELGVNTKEDIAALKTSLNALQDKVDNISLDELVSADNRLYIVDNAGYKIAEIDAEGIHSVNFIIPESGDLKSLTEVLDIVDDKTFYIVDDNGFKIFEINSFGANSVDFLINGKSIKESLASILTDISGLKEAINNVFVSESDKSIEIVDGKENIIAKIDSAGVHSVDFTAYKAKEKVEGAEGTEYDTLTLWEVNDIINGVKQEVEEVKQTITSNDVVEQLQKDVEALETTTSSHTD
jgi:polyhydroxyalkanoate synthesis regulator phasin